MAQPKYTIESSKKLRDDEGGFEFPIEPEFRSFPPYGTWEAGYRLSLIGLEAIKNRPGIWEEREKQRCYEEFKM